MQMRFANVNNNFEVTRAKFMNVMMKSLIIFKQRIIYFYNLS